MVIFMFLFCFQKRVGFAGKEAIAKRYGTTYTVELLGETVC